MSTVILPRNFTFRVSQMLAHMFPQLVNEHNFQDVSRLFKLPATTFPKMLTVISPKVLAIILVQNASYSNVSKNKQ